jgi:hypothetical protein
MDDQCSPNAGAIEVIVVYFYGPETTEISGVAEDACLLYLETLIAVRKLIKSPCFANIISHSRLNLQLF